MRRFLESMFRAAVAAGDPAPLVAGALPVAPGGKTVVIGAGKAAASMASAVEAVWQGPLGGVAITRHGHGLPCEQIEVVEAGHPYPDEEGMSAARRALDSAVALGADDLLLALISGGGSALLALPATGLTLDDKRQASQELLKAGASIDEINTVRKHLSQIKGGRLATAAWPARTVTLAISDVPGDDPATIASGPTIPDSTTLADARAVLARYGVALSAAAHRHLDDPNGETPKIGDPRLARSTWRVLAGAGDALAAAERIAEQSGYSVRIAGVAVEGESRRMAAEFAASLRNPDVGARRQVILSGGELTVRVRGEGRGGPNTEFALALAVALDGMAGVHAIACDTDGFDGSGDNAGAVIGPDTLARAAAAGLDPVAALHANDSYGFFRALGDLVVTGPTRTNLNDFRAIVIE